MAIIRLIAVFLAILVPLYFVSAYYTDTRNDSPLKDRPANQVFTNDKPDSSSQYFY
ncbi:MAG: hypothetical protein P1U63_07285 [Coxiellaceae bacterium]|nr:hypothetical protein [Coxiellaceae bacterium]